MKIHKFKRDFTKLALITVFAIISTQSSENKSISVAEDIIMNVYENNELNNIEFEYWKMRGWIPEDIKKAWIRLDCIKIANRDNLSEMYVSKYNLGFL